MRARLVLSCPLLLYISIITATHQLVKDNQIEDLISLNPEITGEDKEAELLDADIFIQTSRHEGMPMGILEAMSYGLPCIVTEGTSLKEAVNCNCMGWGADISVADITNALMTAIEEKDEWHGYGENALLYVKKHFSWDEVSKNTVNTYSRMIDG